MKDLAYKDLIKNYKEKYGCDLPHHHINMPYPLTPSIHNDGLSALAKGINHFLGTFLHHVYTKHPFTGLVFTLACTSGSLSILTPKLMASILGKKFVTFS